MDRKEYSLYYKKNKYFTDICTNLKRTIQCLYNIEENLMSDYILSEKTISILIDIGVIENKDELLVLKEKLGKEFNSFINTFESFQKINIKREKYDDSLKIYCDWYRKEKLILSKKEKNKKFIDLFAGSGGLSLGFTQEGFIPILANDIEEVCGETYSFNHPEISKEKVMIGDISKIYEEIILNSTEEVDLIIGGPPCQSFSMANRQRIIDDPRNSLYKYYVEIVGKVKPKFFVMENVKGMIDVAEQVKEDFHNLVDVDYEVDYKIFSSFDFSVPQTRERLIYIGVRRDLDIRPQEIIKEIYDESVNNKKFLLKDALANLKELQPFRLKNSTEKDTEESGKKIDVNYFKKSTEYLDLINNNRINPLVFNHKSRYNNDRDIEIFGRMLQGDKSDSPRIADIMPYHSRNDVFKDKYHKMELDRPSKTITAHMKFDCNMYIHPTQARGLTPREAARIQSYPDSYLFLGSYTKTYMQIGNSVPPLMARHFAKVIKKYL